MNAVAEAAREQNIPLPPFTGQAMGTARISAPSGARVVTFKRRLVTESQAKIDGVEWTLWMDHDEVPSLIAAFRKPAVPKPDDVRECLLLIKGWLIDQWTPDEAKAAVRRTQPALADSVLRRTGS
ncbi:MAG: hypothetical protein WD069_13395 [Planctomycetales bacterium]